MDGEKVAHWLCVCVCVIYYLMPAPTNQHNNFLTVIIKNVMNFGFQCDSQSPST